MKTLNFYLVLLTITLLINGCEPLKIDKKGQNNLENYYADEDALNEGIVGIYALLHNATRGVDIFAAYTGADDFTIMSSYSSTKMREGDQFKRWGNNSRINYIWERYYVTINNCNSLIKNANSELITEELLNDAKANALFVRALLYFRLATIFGDIPMPLDPVPDLKIKATSQREVLEQCINDLELAARWATGKRDLDPNIKDGYVTKTASNALLSKVYMQLTGWPYNENDKWINVKSTTKAIIDKGVYSLMDDYIHNFQDPYQMNKEIISSHICKKNDWPENTASRCYGYMWMEWGDLILEHNFYNNFPSGYRKRISTLSVADTATYTDFTTQYYKHLLNRNSHPRVTKYCYATIKGKPEFEHVWQTSNDIPIMRYAEVLLMYAEACANTGELQNALDALNLVKRRAFAKGVISQEEVQLLPTGFWKNTDSDIDYKLSELSTKETIIDAIVFERAYEFIGEPGGNRWLDLIRLEKVGEVNAHRIPGHPEFIDGLEELIMGDPSDKSLWYFEIPTGEFDLN